MAMKGDRNHGSAASGDHCERKNPPEKCQHTDGDGYLGSEAESKNSCATEQQEIKKSVRPLMSDVKSWRSSLPDQLRKPGVVSVTGQIAGFDLAMPETRNDDEGGARRDSSEARLDESQSAKHGAAILRCGGSITIQQLIVTHINVG